MPRWASNARRCWHSHWLDEPFNALDVASAHHLSETLTARAAQGEQVILLTSHVEPHVPVRDTWVLGT